jgi:citrate lyase gamma subunit
LSVNTIEKCTPEEDREFAAWVVLQLLMTNAEAHTDQDGLLTCLIPSRKKAMLERRRRADEARAKAEAKRARKAARLR